MGFFSRSDPGDPEDRRRRMVEDQIRRRGVDDPLVLEAMRRVPRHLFVPPDRRDQAYQDRALPIGHGQTISQPYIVARMTALLEPEEELRVLEVGTGSGYQAAVLAACGMEVYTIERIPALLDRAQEALAEAELAGRVHLEPGDGSRGWPEAAPFDRIIVTAAASRLPQPLREQLGVPGLAIAPVGGRMTQTLRRFRKTDEGWTTDDFDAARFVPLISEVEGGHRPRDTDREGDA